MDSSALMHKTGILCRASQSTLHRDAFHSRVGFFASASRSEVILFARSSRSFAAASRTFPSSNREVARWSHLRVST